MRILVALGGNALSHRAEAAEAGNRRRSVEPAATEIAALAAEHEVVITHGYGPEDGHLLELALRNALPDRDLVTVSTAVVVSADDPAFHRPSKPVEPDDGRPVPSPEPRAIAELRSLRTLIDAGALVICAGGAVPVAVDGTGEMHGVEAVIDKDLTAALLARRLDADMLVMLTDVDGVHRDWGSDGHSAMRSISPAELRRMRFAAGSMGPKVEAACRFVEATDRRAAIGALTDAVQIARGAAGTQVSALPA